MLKINSEYSIARADNTLFLLHFGRHFSYTTFCDHDNKVLGTCSSLCSMDDPILYLTTQNIDEMVLRNLLPQVKGAVCKTKEISPWMDEDPYGRRVQRGSYSFEIWDLSKLFENITKPDIVFAGTNYTNRYKLLNK